MSNPKPRHSQSYKNFPDPKLKTRDVLIAIVAETDEYFTALDVAEHFKITNNEAAVRLGLLKKWGCIKVVEKGKQHIPHKWEITEWGNKMAEKWTKEA